ncbi:hypothetical protein I3842_01G024200 [Carya illinoinensis]|uniref:Uncharacterized protein n=1 Tax=Carya illinoinensis TaxID=32201 RepID=A0A922FYV6_CARIL|nr:hypothetical protein I3842_01G024200 [Carya illinoinensis]KAG6729353.1 hypothetical protein I3842_01G024200 [Carya illinoinensis]KAG6729354.1 hypothetical protein I3842_01G024200 [Carya illinoinensis]KAG6729355.1 hypothetical protein I3842_01G024200 [Carya illinoinensis]KAG6729356.1 hypothetical protein I3842_01G024200 [Carya illinoinensis]
MQAFLVEGSPGSSSIKLTWVTDVGMICQKLNKSCVLASKLTLSYNGKNKTIIRWLPSNYIGGSILSTTSYTKSTSAMEVIKLLFQEGPRWQGVQGSTVLHAYSGPTLVIAKQGE